MRLGRRQPSLLDFAIGASLAVVPAMLAVVLLVSVVRPADPGPGPGRWPVDRYLSVRHVAALKTFEDAVVRRPDTAAPVPTAAAVLDAMPACRREWRAGAGPAQWLRWLPGSDRTMPSPAEHIATQLAAFDAALGRFSERANTRVSRPVGFDAARWFAAANASMATVIEAAEYPGRQFRIQCADLVAALHAISRADARMLESLAWRGSEGSATLARWHPEQEMEITARLLMRSNPWSGVPGCIYLGRSDGAAARSVPTHFVAGARGLRNGLCGTPAMSGADQVAAPALVPLAGEPGPADPVDDARWMVPPSLTAMLQPLESLRRPSGALYRLYTDAATAPASAALADATGYRYGPNRLMLNGRSVDVGFSVGLTIDPASQALAQKTAACYTGRHDVCRALGLRRAEDKERPIGQQLLEGAMVRMAAVAMIDVASGRIEALAGTMSPCARQEVDGPGRDPSCDRRLPYPVRYRPDALLNPSVFHDAMPASTIKPILAAAFLSDPQVGARWLATERSAMKRVGIPARDSLRGQLMRSDSARFLDRMFCIDKGFANCHRPQQVQAAAAAFGWNAGCTDPSAVARVACGQHDLLFGSAADVPAAVGDVRPLATPVAYGRLLSEPVGGGLGPAMHLMPPAPLDATLVRRCAAGPDGRRLNDDDWEKCRGGAMVDVVAEGWGQGHARASALGVAGMMATLAAAANGQAEVRRPHLVESMHGVGGAGAASLATAAARWGLAAPRAHGLSPDAAAVILDALSYSHRAGTARSACEQVFDARRCQGLYWLAGKTGTPSFPSDGVPLDALARLCAATDAARHGRPGVCGSLRPYKWYVAAYRADHASSGPWTKVIAVLTERNWLRRSGQVHGAGDHGPNPAAEIAMQIVGRRDGMVVASAP